MLWLVAADLVTAIHTAYVAFVVIGFVAILVGWGAEWRWVQNLYFRAIHLSMILLVCGEAMIGATCPLTTWENALRLRGGETGYAQDFIGYWLDWLIFYRAPNWVFTTVYLAFGGLVLLSFWVVPVEWPGRNRSSALTHPTNRQGA